jgi:colicin import membrane protein
MTSSQAHLEFAPAPEGGKFRALVLAVVVHLMLVVALNWGTLWSQQPQDMSVEAELWSAVPQAAAPKLEAPPQPEPTPVAEPEPEPEPVIKPTLKPAQEVKPLIDPQIAIDKLKKKQVEDKRRAEEESKRKAQDKQEAKEAEEAKARHAQAVRRLQNLAGSVGTPVDTGVAPKPSGPSASYIGRLRAKVKPNITFPDNLLQTVVGNPTADVEVTCSPTGKIESGDLLKSRGNSAWDQAVINGLRKTEILPRDIDGSVPTRLVFSFRPRD